MAIEQDEISETADPRRDAKEATRLNAERVRFMYRMSAFGSLATALIAVVTGGYFWSTRGSTAAIVLAGLFIAIAVIRTLVYISYRRATDIDVNPQPWITAATVMNFAAGVGWGALAWWLFAVDLPSSALIVTVVVASVLVSAVLLLAPFSRVILAFTVPAAVPLLAKLIAAGDAPYLMTAALVGLVIMTAYLTALRIQDGLKQWLRLALENKELAKVMSTSRDELEKLNEELSAQVATRSRVEEELRQAKRAAEAAVMAKDEFLATMSHEIRTPLNGILPILDILRSTKLDETQKDYLHTAFTSSKHLLSIIDDILDYSKIEAGKLDLETVGLNLRELLDSVVRLMSGTASKKGIELRTRIEPGVRIALRGDPVRLRQILTNLVSNAIKFTESGYVEISISSRRETRDKVELVFGVKDTGIGMDRATSERLFRPFSQADASTTRTYGGTGLGLAICKRLVEMMHGTIGVKSEPGRGSIFWFSAQFMKSLGDIPADRTELGQARVLLGCGDGALRQRLTVFLESWGTRTMVTTNLRETAAKIRDSLSLGESWSYHALLLDLPSLGTQALELARRVRQDPRLKGVALLVLTDDGTLPAPLKGLEATGGLTRTCSQGALAEGLERVLDREPDPAEEPLEATHDDAYASEATPTATSLSGRLLLVEDNPVNLHVAQKLLGLVGCDFEVAKNGKEALSKLKASSYDAVLMDCMMPVMDGYAATTQWRTHETAQGLRRTPIIAMTANAMAGDRQKCLDAGMDDYMAKPLNRLLLNEILSRWLTRDAVAEPAPVTPLPVAQAPAPAPLAVPTPAATVDPAPAAVPKKRTAARVSARPALDRQVLDDLIDIMGDEYLELISIYLEDAPKSLSELQRAAAAGDVAALVAPAHSLKSTSANLGAMTLSHLAKEVETEARLGRTENPTAKVQAMMDEFQQVMAELERFREAS